MGILEDHNREEQRIDRFAERLTNARHQLPGRPSTNSAMVQRESQWPDPIADDAFYGIAGEVVSIIEPHTEADISALLIQTLTAAGSIIGRGPHVRVEGDEHHANLFSVIVGQSAKARKGTSWGRVRKLFEMLPDEWSARRVQSGLSSGEGVIWAVRDQVDDDDPGVDDKRLCLIESEFAGLLRVMTRDGNIVSRIVRDAWDRGDLQTLTKTSPSRATGAHISIIGHITRDELVRYLDRTEAANGFANRFLYIASKRSKLLPFGGTLKDSDLVDVARRLAEVITEARRIQSVEMDNEAKRIWERVYPVLSADHPGLFGSIIARAEAQALRVALVYALLDTSPEIRPEHLRAALAVWEYAQASAQYVFGDATGDPEMDKLMGALREAGSDGMTRTNIRDLFKRHKSARVDELLRSLEHRGRVFCERTPTPGRPQETWFLTGFEPLKGRA